MSLKGYKDIEHGREQRKKDNSKYYSNSGLYKTRRWTLSECERILDRSYSDAELSEMLKRSIRSIQVKRTRLINGNV